MLNVREAKESFEALPRVRQGVLLALATGLISGVSVFVNRYAVAEFDDPTIFTTFKNLLVGTALVLLVLRRGAMAEVRSLPGRGRLGLVTLGVVGGSIPFVLFFEGLARVEAGNAAFIHKTLFLWVAVLAVVLLRERLGPLQIGALALLLMSQLLLGGPGSLTIETGTAIVLAATLLWSVEVVLAKYLLRSTSSNLGAAGRMGVGASLMLAYVIVTGRVGDLAGLSAVQWAWGIGTGLLLLAYVTTWYAGLKRAPAVTVTAVLTVGAPITAALSAIAGRGLPDPSQALGYLALAIAVAAIAAPGLWRRQPKSEEAT